MHLVTFAVEHFRNLTEARLSPSLRFNIFEGRNGQGKTNVLEAIYLLSAFRSFRDARNRELVQWGAERAVTYGEIVRRDVKRSVQVEIGAQGKRVALDGKTITSLPSDLAHLNVVLFGPDDLALTKAGPAQRRRFIDRAIYAVWPDYLNDLRSYQRALKQRNSLLRQGQASGIRDVSLVEAFEHELITYAARVIDRRLRFVRSFRPHFTTVFGEITGGELVGEIGYRGYRGLNDDATLEQLSDGFAAAIGEHREVDVKRGFTGIGPHTDDLTFKIDGRSTRTYASQGQHRAFVLALKIAELQRIHDAIGVFPVFLLDDVSSELDEARNRTLMEYLDRAGGQVFITTTDRRWIQVSGAAHVYRVSGGAIELTSSIDGPIAHR